ncbi:hypothetical protein AAFF_G00388680 [Aldrovandia affinis]|uniref:E3 ubiquitin/ISG15 ligase TRIM25-like n=1 Tax=Aldrovandia affinis TaxID=143900 RepID=A0AAD7VZ97_9TELE|nr:hypothetical protein AAFF_G00388680 [Aldrovandia affinis]
MCGGKSVLSLYSLLCSAWPQPNTTPPAAVGRTRKSLRLSLSHAVTEKQNLTLSVSVTVFSKMAQAADLLDQDQFSCPICLDLLKDPVAIPCGHSYCMGCIKGCWDQNDHTGVYSCPQCRETFTPRPVLRRNTMLAEVVEKLKKTGLQAATPAHSYAGPGDVACDFCTGRKHKAVKSCLVCVASFCETHLQPHYESPAFMKHKLTPATGHLQEKICSHHDKLLEVYCRTDQQCICYQCVMDEHRGHDTVSAAAERTEKQKQLGETQRKSQQRIQEREKDLRQAVDSLTVGTDHRRTQQLAAGRAFSGLSQGSPPVNSTEPYCGEQAIWDPSKS